MNSDRRNCRVVWLLVLLCAGGAFSGADPRAGDEEPAGAPVGEQEPLSLEDREFFEKSVRPVLIERCQDCHSSDGPESGLSVEHLADLLKGGERGRAIVPGKPEESLLIRALSHGDVELQMPPKEKLPADELAAITDWVRRGAFWPGERAVADPDVDADSDSLSASFTEEQLAFWSFQPPASPSPPAVEDAGWIESPIDHFVLSRLEAAGMRPAPAADRRTLIRRVYFNLLGLPPSPEAIAQFVSDDSPDAYLRLIDRCLGSPHYGERWGRRWLDVARYADSNGLDENLAYAHAFRYRDYVVAAVNEDRPYDEFVHEQLAGDLLNADPASATDSVEVASRRHVATGFLSLGGKMLAEDDPLKMQMDIIDEQVDTLGRAFMGLTFGCGRCHDHKFDPFTQDDYYALAGIFKSTRTMENFKVVARWQELPLGSANDIALLNEQKQKIDVRKKAVSEFQSQQNEQVLAEARERIDRYLLAAHRAELRSRLIANAQPQGDALDGEIPDGVQLLEAEQFDRANVDVHTAGYGEGIGVLVNAGPTPNFAEYDIACNDSGVFQLEIRHAAAESRPVRILVDGVIVFPDALTGVTGSWFPDTQSWTIAGYVELSGSEHTLRIERDGPFSHIDKLLLTPVTGDATVLASADTQADGEPLHAVFVEGWRKLLSGTLPDGSLLGPAQRALQGLPADEWFAELSNEVAALFGDALPDSTAALAEAYASMLRDDDAEEEPPAALARLREVVADANGPFKLPKEPESLYGSEIQAELKQLRDELTTLEGGLPKLPEAMAVTDAEPENLRIHLRGSHLNLGSEVSRHLPAIFESGEEVSVVGTSGGSGRLELAQWLTQGEHPLTARVMVNRIWLWHFGEGLVRSPDNFGLLGEAPTHPELLDWLAVEFMESGWSLKDLHRLILTSATYRMSTQYRADYNAVDPENRLLWRMNRRRLDAESIRDAVLSVSGELDTQMQGSLLPTANRAYVTSTASVNPDVYKTNRRSLYVPVVRSALYEMFQAFDFADPSTLSGRRESTTVASQALFMMNSELVAQNSAALADRIAALPDLSDQERVARLFEQLFGREPTEDETTGALEYIRAYADAAASGDDGEAAAGWRSLCRALISSNEFLYLE